MSLEVPVTSVKVTYFPMFPGALIREIMSSHEVLKQNNFLSKTKAYNHIVDNILFRDAF